MLVRFDAAKKKARNCKKGQPCGNTCIAKLKRNGDPMACRQKPSDKDGKDVADLASNLSSSRLRPGTVTDLDVDAIEFDPNRFQYKLVHGSTGSSGSLTGVEYWDPNLAGIIQVWQDPSDGKTYVVNGHNRLSKARDLGVEQVTVRSLIANSPEEARSIGALTNIAEGRGNPLDAAKFFRDTELTADDLRRRGIPLREKIANDGLALSQLEPSLFRKVVDGEIPIERASIIGAAGLGNEQQLAVVDLIGRQRRNVTNAVVKELTDSVRMAGTQESTQQTLFGAETLTESLALERAQVAANLRGRLSREARLFGTVASSRAASELERGGNVINQQQSQQISRQAAQALDVFDQLKGLAGPVSDLLNEGARRVAEGEQPNAVSNELAERLPNIISEI